MNKNKLPHCLVRWLLGSLLCCSFTAMANPQPARISALAVKSLLTDIVATPNGTLISVGDRGHILRSSDGQNWTQAEVPLNVLLTDVFFFDDDHGWAVGHDASILATTDGGVSWSIQHNKPSIDKPLFAVHFYNLKQGIVVGAYGLFLRTNDGGKRWQSEFHDEFLHPDDLAYLNELKAEEPEAYADETASILPHFNRLLVDGDVVYLVGEVGFLAQSSDFGAHWQKVEGFYNGSFFDIAKVNGVGLMVGGLRGNLFANPLPRADQSQWQKIAVPATTSINRILSQTKQLVLVGNSGLLMRSTDQGKTFTSHQQSDGKAITGGVFVDNQLILSSEVGIKVIDSKQW